MKKLLVLFANGFPYANGEPFLENEYPLYAEYFDKVLLVTACTRRNKPARRLSPYPIEVCRDYTLSKDVLSILEALPRMLCDKMFYAELKDLCQSGFSIRKLYRLLVFSLCGNQRAWLAERWIRKHPVYDAITIYSYWLHIPAYSAVRLQQRLHTGYTISRAHGYDLYLERHPDHSIPFHKQLVHSLHEVAVISENGRAYLQQHYGSIPRFSVYHLGAKNRNQCGPTCDRDTLHIVTCSRTVPLKRLDRIVDTLRLLADRQITWTHIGGGEVQAALEAYAKENLPSSMTATFTNTIPNEKIYDIYAKAPFHIFLNVSETEGVPVSIMEAMSFGIPVIATAVGGTGELVQNGENGFLLPVDFTEAALAERITQIMDMPENAYQHMRERARNTFLQAWDTEANYRAFLAHIADPIGGSQ